MGEQQTETTPPKGNSVDHDDVDHSAMLEARMENLEEIVDSVQAATNPAKLTELQAMAGKHPKRLKKAAAAAASALEAAEKATAAATKATAEVARLSAEHEQLAEAIEKIVERLQGLHAAVEELAEAKAAE